jgi:hypothetical protein
MRVSPWHGHHSATGHSPFRMNPATRAFVFALTALLEFRKAVPLAFV